MAEIKIINGGDAKKDTVPPCLAPQHNFIAVAWCHASIGGVAVVPRVRQVLCAQCGYVIDLPLPKEQTDGKVE